MKKTPTEAGVQAGVSTPACDGPAALPGADGAPDQAESAPAQSDDGAVAPSTGRTRRRPPMTPAQRALSLLVRREHSRPELRRKLLARGVEADEADAAIERMAREGWQDDARFAASLARSRVATGYGPVHIEAELAMHRLDATTIAAAFAALDEEGASDWPALARDLLERRYRGVDLQGDPALRRKAADLLLRRGFPGDIAYAAIRGLPED